jgi:hypothetical protein
MQLLFGLPAEEAVQVYAACCTSSRPGLGALLNAGSKPLRVALGSSEGVPGVVSGCIYLSANYLAFTDLLGDSADGNEDADAVAKRVAKAVEQAQAAAKKTGQPAAAAAAANAAAAGATGSSNPSGGLSTRSWWKLQLLSSSDSSSSETAPVAPAVQQTAAAAGGSPASAAAAKLAADTTVLLPLADVARLDKIYHKGHEALALTMLKDRSLHVFSGFESAAVRDKLHDAVRLAVMGSNTVLDRNLRCCEETVGENVADGELCICGVAAATAVS